MKRRFPNTNATAGPGRKAPPPGPGSPAENDVGRRLRTQRLQAHLSMRELARRAGVAVSYISNLEAGRVTPSLAKFRTVLKALDTDLGPFFAEGQPVSSGHVFRRQDMHRATDSGRSYTFVLPQRPDIGLIMFDEELFAGENPDFEAMTGDIAGYVLTGELVLEVEGTPPRILRPGDAFYIPAGERSRGFCGDAPSVRLLTTQLRGTVSTEANRDRASRSKPESP